MSFIAPDWRVESNYADPKSEKSLSFWAWEFLRRSPAYNATWAEYVSSLRELAWRRPDVENCINHIVAGTTSSLPREEREAFWEQAFEAVELMHFFPTRCKDESFDEWSQRASRTGQARCTPLDTFMGRKYNLRHIVNPALPYWANGFPQVQFENSGLNVSQRAPGNSAEPRMTFEEIFYGTRMTIEFDLNSPDSVLVAQLRTALAGQRRRIRKKPEAEEELRPNGSLSLFRTYLRVLDARAEGVDLWQIGLAIVPHKTPSQQSADAGNWEKRALVLRDLECITMPAYEGIKVKKK